MAAIGPVAVHKSRGSRALDKARVPSLIKAIRRCPLDPRGRARWGRKRALAPDSRAFFRTVTYLLAESNIP
jgi:hypothetical protein